MENLAKLDKHELVDRLVKCTKSFAEAYLSGKTSEDLADLRKHIEMIQKEIMSRTPLNKQAGR